MMFSSLDLSKSYLLSAGLAVLASTASAAAYASSAAPSLELIKEQAGCYIVDYSYSETEALKEGYTLDPRVYDASGFLVKEWIEVVKDDGKSVRLQHFMQADDFRGNNLFNMRHHAEVWTPAPEFRYVYLGPINGQKSWGLETFDSFNTENSPWLREVTSLDDGPRYQCLGNWSSNFVYPRFTCSAVAPIPGRETRDMSRRDYNVLNRKSIIDFYEQAWLERQDNTKVIFTEDQERIPLAREVGKIWSTRVSDDQCASVKDWATERQAFWDILERVWSDVYAEAQPFNEIRLVDGTTRAQKINELREQFYALVGREQAVADFVELELTKIVGSHISY